MTKKITISYFPKGLRYSTPLFFGAGLYLIITGSPVFGILLSLVGLLIMTTEYVTEINLKDKKYRDYLSLLWIPINEDSKKFNAIDRIIISKGNYAQTVNTRVQSRQFDWSDYTGTLILDTETLDLLTRNNKQELLKGLKEFSDFLHVGVEDRTTHEHYWVDMTKF